MGNISTYLQQIMNAVYGEQVRSAIHDAINQCYIDASAGITPTITVTPVDGGTRVDIAVGADIISFVVQNGTATTQEVQYYVTEWLEENPDFYTTEVELLSGYIDDLATTGTYTKKNFYRCTSGRNSGTAITENSKQAYVVLTQEEATAHSIIYDNSVYAVEVIKVRDGSVISQSAFVTTSPVPYLDGTYDTAIINFKRQDTADLTAMERRLTLFYESSVGGVALASDLDDKVDKVTGKGLSTEDYTTDEKTKLAGLTQIEVDDTLSVAGRAADAKKTGDEITGLKADLNGGQRNISYVQTGTGLIQEAYGRYSVNYTPGATGNNSIMAINDLSSAGLSAGDIVIIKVGWASGYEYAAGFSNVPFASTQEVFNVVPFASQESVQEIEFTIPDGMTAMVVFNRANVYGTPAISITKQGLESRVSSVEEVLLPLQTEVENIGETVSGINIDEINAIISNGTETINLSDLEFESGGYINYAGNFVNTTSPTHKIVKMDASRLSYISFQSSTALVAQHAFGVLKDSNDNVVQVFACDGTTNRSEWDIAPADGNVLYVTFWGYATVPNQYYDSFLAKDHLTIVDAYKPELLELTGDANAIKYNTCVKKPFNFADKMLYFFGDSITYGYIAQSGSTPAHQATNQYPKLFSESVGANFVNQGVSGLPLSPVTGYTSIYEKIQNTTLNCDILFIAGGVNDWQLGVDEATLKTTVTNICTYLQSNFNGEVIFITPIYEAGRVPNVTPTQTLQNVRNVITRIALEYGHSVVQGWEFPFPTKKDDSNYISLMFQDKIHPTELGYSMYAQALKNALC